MARFLKDKKASVGHVPGDLIFIGEQKLDKIDLQLIDYDRHELREESIEALKDITHWENKESVSWINIHGLHDTEIIQQMGEIFNLHPLTLEDILNTGQRPKMEEYDDYVIFTLKMMNFDELKNRIRSEQLSIILGETFLITLQEVPGDVFDPVRDRIRKNRGRIRKRNSDYLAYALLDTIVDNYLVIIGRIGEKIEEMEIELLSNPSKELLAKIFNYKQEMSYLRKSIRPTRDFIQHMNRLDVDFLHEKTTPFIKDLLDLSTQAVEIIDVYSEMLSDHLNLYDSITNNKLNEIMKVLTIFSVIFIPLTFIAVIYGTNFEYLPELKYKYSYFIFWGVLIATAASMLLYFKKKSGYRLV